MSLSLFATTWESFEGSTSERLVALAIADCSGADGRFQLDTTHLAAKCRMTPAQFNEILEGLVSAGWIEISCQAKIAKLCITPRKGVNL